MLQLCLQGRFGFMPTSDVRVPTELRRDRVKLLSLLGLVLRVKSKAFDRTVLESARLGHGTLAELRCGSESSPLRGRGSDTKLSKGQLEVSCLALKYSGLLVYGLALRPSMSHLAAADACAEENMVDVGDWLITSHAGFSEM